MRYNGIIHKIQFTQGCLNGCAYCYEPKREIKFFNPKIPNNGLIQILDMNFLINPDSINILKKLPKGNYEFVCGIDYRRLNQEITDLMKEKGFLYPRWAWDYNLGLQREQYKTYRLFLKSGYKPNDLGVFILTNWKIPYSDCLRKLDILKVWNVKALDCCFDGGYKLAKPIYWFPEDIKKFRALSRKHNQLVRFKIDPEMR